jgi:hypothetical protein
MKFVPTKARMYVYFCNYLKTQYSDSTFEDKLLLFFLNHEYLTNWGTVVAVIVWQLDLQPLM